MSEQITIKPIAHIHTPLKDKFGVPRQSGVVKELIGTIVFEKEYRVKEAFRGLEGFSHIWIIWQFSKAVRDEWSPTVRPPRLNGNVRMGVFATRSPFRPNNIGMSCVKIEQIDLDAKDGPTITVSGVDMMDNTPIIDIKPYIPYADSYPDALSGFTVNGWRELEVELEEELKKQIPSELLSALIGVLKNDPRPPYKEDSDRVYKLLFDKFDIGFTVNNGILKVVSVEKVQEK